MTKALQIERRPFGRTGLRVSSLGFGGAPVGLLQTEQDSVAQVLQTLLDHGINVIDTAAMYYGSEAMIGKTIGHRRDEYVLISKCGRPAEDLVGEGWTAPLIERTIDRSLQRLQTDCIDVMLLHSCDLETLQRGEAIEAVVRARDAGKVRFAGYSGDNEAAAFAAGHPDVAVIQTSLNLCDQVNIDLVLPATGQHDVGVMAKRPIANAAWKSTEQQYEQYRNYAAPYQERFAAMGLTLEALEEEGDPNRLWPELAIRFTLSFPGVHTAIIGTTKTANVHANLAAAAKGPLSQRQVDVIRKAFAEADDGGWEGLT